MPDVSNARINGIQIVRVREGRSGTDGAQGAAGIGTRGVGWLFNTTTTIADPGTGYMRLDSATLSSVTRAAFADQCGESGNPDMSAYVTSWDDADNTVRGKIELTVRSRPENFAIYTINDVLVDNSGWTDVPLTYVTSSGSFSLDDTIDVSFTRYGDTGPIGPTGATGAAGADGADGADGTMTGPASSTDNAIVRWNGTAGTTVQNSSVWVVDDSGRLIANSATAVTNDPLEVWATSTLNASFGRWTANTTAFNIKIHKSRGTSVGTHGLVASGDRLGEISFRGSDGTSFYDGGMIRVQASGTPAAGSVPATMYFMVSNGNSTQSGVAGGATTAWEINSSMNFYPSVDNTSSVGISTRRLAAMYLYPTGSIYWSGGGPTLTVPSSTTLSLDGRLIIDGTGANTNLAVVPGNSSEGIQPILFQTKGGTSLHPLIVSACGDNHAGFGTASFGSSSPTIWIARSAGTTFTDFSVMSSGNTLGEITWNGADGVDFAPAASIYVKVDGTPGSDDMPGKIIFATTSDGAATTTDRWSIDSTGLLSGTGSVIAHNGTAIPAGGTAGAGIRVSSTSNFGVFFGSGAPTLSAAKGSLYLRSDGSTTNDRMYVNTNGSTTWTAVTTVA